MMFHPESPFRVYCRECWLSDSWNPMSYSKNFDSQKPFIEQLAELIREVPRPATIQQGNIVGSEYTNRVSDLKNCYMIFGSAENENCYYGVSYWKSKESMDCYNIHNSERCYELIDCHNCNNLKYSEECNSCSNSAFLINCTNCESCFGCVNQKNKTYCIFNDQYSREEYLEKMKEFNLESRTGVEKIHARLDELRKKHIVPSLVEHHTANSTGNWLEECKNVHEGYNCDKVEDGKFLFGVVESKDVMDLTYWGKSSELIYESCNVGRQCSSVFFANECWDQLVDSQYVMNCHGSSNLFGCVGLRKKQFCILNKQYAEEEYLSLREKIIESMKTLPYKDKIGRVYRYGEFFPSEILPFAYNETIAQEYNPITKEEATKLGYEWRESESKNYSVTLKPENIPDSIAATNDSIIKETIGCVHAGKCKHMCTTAFRITESEFTMYGSFKIPPPKLCPNCRHYKRLESRAPIKTWRRKCQCAGKQSTNESYKNTSDHFHGSNPCPNDFKTSYTPERKEVVYCKQCYSAEVA